MGGDLGDISGARWRFDYFNRKWLMMGMITVGFGWLSTLFSALEACALLASKVVWMGILRQMERQ